MAPKLLGIDYGLHKVGLAFFDGFLIEPIGVLTGKKKSRLVNEVLQLAIRLEVDKIIVGLPQGGAFLKPARAFVRRLKLSTKIEIEETQEILTTREALARMKETGGSWQRRAAKEDAVAAAILLEDYLAGLTNV